MALAKRIGIGCGVLVLVFVALIAAIYVGVRMLTAEPEQAVRDFLAAAAAGDYAKAHDYFSAPLKESQPLDQLKQAAEKTPSLFSVADFTFNSRSIDTNGAKLAGNATLKAGTTVPASFELVKEGDRWKLLSYRLGSAP